MSSVAADPVEDLVAATGLWASERLDALATDRVARLPVGLLDELGGMGLFGISVPTEYGGLGLDLGECCAVIAELARYDRAVATTIGLHAGLGTRGLIRYGSREQHALWLPGVATGRTITAFAATEPGAGSDLSAISTRLSASPGGLSLRGEKAFVTNGGFASLYTVLCDSPGLGAARGQSLALVERADAGLSIGAEEHKLGLRGSSTTAVHFDDVALPGERLLGPAGKGAELAHHVLAWGRTAMAAGCLGTARAALDRVRTHVVERRQFGKPLAAQEVVQHQIAHALALVATMQALVDHTADAPDDQSLTARSLAAKIICSEGSSEVVDLGVQLHGGLGFIEESGMPLLLRDARITRIFEGANDVLAWRLGALAAMSPPTHGRRAGLVTRVADHRADLVEAFGAKLFRHAIALHRLGRLTALAEAARAIDAAKLPGELAACALHRLDALATPLFETPRDVRGIATRWLAQEVA